MENSTTLHPSAGPVLPEKNWCMRTLHWYGQAVQRLIVAIIILTGTCGKVLQAQRLSRDLDVSFLTNQVGYLPSAPKTGLLKRTESGNFEVVEVTSGRVVYRGTLMPQAGDFGSYCIADFSKVIKEGRYYLRADSVRSYPFSIAHAVYQPAMQLIVGYFAKQRCGASTTGYLTPCHIDDGIRVDNGRHQDVSGGWHDASDLRKWVSATLYGVIGLAKAYNRVPPQHQKDFLAELRWGNQYFLKMQEPQGYVMDFIGGDLEKHSDNNRWTDNKIESGGSDIKLVPPNAGISKQLMLVSAGQDDRIIQTQPVERLAQYNFVMAEALVAHITATTDPAYSRQCLTAARKCYDWCQQSGSDTTTGTIGAALQAAIEMYRATSSKKYYSHAIELALRLRSLQATDSAVGVSGFFYTSPSGQEPYKNIWNGCQAFIGLSDMLHLFPNDRYATIWKSMLQNYAEQYLLRLAKQNSFALVPWGLYQKADPGGNRKVGSLWYRYFMQPELEWWVGINANIASAGIGLLKAAVHLKNPDLKAVAQKQLDWILGSNPFSSSTMLGVGYNHPAHFPGSSFLPTVPLLPGAVLNGLGGDKDDMPAIGTGDWQISEYWTPMVAYTLWLMAELSAGK